MKSEEIIQQLEDLIKAEKAKMSTMAETSSPEPEVEIKEPVKTEIPAPADKKTEEPSYWDFILDLIKAPFRYFSKYFRRELTEAIRNDLRRVMMITLLSMVVFAIIIAFWLTIQTAIYLYLVSAGFTQFHAILISAGIQLLSLLLILFIMYRNAHNMDTVKIIRRLKD